jgi:hypothetical protein
MVSKEATNDRINHLRQNLRPRRPASDRQTQEHRTTALTIYRELDMEFWLERAAPDMR